ncbi:MAG TPA: VOC family protein [Candidatus Limnocylindrales bacterium]
MAHGQLTHLEIPADDLPRARRFYSELLGWEIGDMPEFADYPLFSFGAIERAGGALGLRGKTVGNQLRVYFDVDSIDQVLPKVARLGGKVVEPKTEIPNMGWYAVIDDTEGNQVALYQGMPQPAM